MDLQTAAVTTNAAFDLVRRSEDDILSVAPQLFNRKRSWDTISIIIFYADAFEQGVCPETRIGTNEALRITPFDDFIYLSVARILMKFTFVANAPKGALDWQYPLPAPPMRFGYISRPELLEEPGMPEKEDEDRILSQLIIDQHLWRTIRETTRQLHQDYPPPVEDELSIGLERLMLEGEITVATVFAARIYLDIQKIMKDKVGNGLKDLLATTSDIDRIMNLKVHNGGKYPSKSPKRSVSDHKCFSKTHDRSFAQLSYHQSDLIAKKLRSQCIADTGY